MNIYMYYIVMLVKVSHESPISILQTSTLYNDFDYALVHLFETHPKYYQYYKTAREVYNREVLLDNSIYELGHAFDGDKFLAAAIDLKPNMFIVPDVLESALDTVMSFENWQDDGSIKAVKDVCVTKAIGAVQGKTWQELTECYKFMSDNADMIAISFDFSYYEITGEGWTTPSKLMERCLKGSVRVFGLDMILNPPKRYTCEKCAWASLEPLHAGCIESHLDIPNLSKTFFVDDSLTLHKPPSGSKVFTLLQPPPHASDPQSSEQ